MKDYSDFTDEELSFEVSRIYQSCASWASSTDGSHGMALHNAGIDDVREEIEKRKKAK